jgi:hypothetical protein
MKLRLLMESIKDSNCKRTVLVYLFVMFDRISYGRFTAVGYKFKRPTYIQEPLVIGRRSTERDLNEKTVSSR